MKRLLNLIFLIVFISGCRVFVPSQMLRQGKYPISQFPDTLKQQEYRIAVNDQLQINLYTNEGEKIIDPVGIANNIANQTSNSSYLVEFDGRIKLPIIGRTQISNLTLREAEKILEENYSSYFNKPFVQIKVTNNRVTIFPGGQGSQALVVPLDNPNTTLFEALALAGGIQDGKAHRIKLIRGDLKNPQVYLIDLSTIEGITNANLILQANDIIYVEPRNKIPQKIIDGITPYLTLLSTFLLIYGLFVK
jgi:polysaccharide biosynthesis/export protein